MIKHTFLDKCCTILKNSEHNTGLSPVAELNYGKENTRVLIHFDISELQELYNDKTYCNLDSLRHILKLTNCGSIDKEIHRKVVSRVTSNNRERASSFDVLLFKVPNEWDGGKGVDYNSDFWFKERRNVSTEGCNWFQRMNGAEWDSEGIYTTEFISKEYDKFSRGEDSIVVARQHFDIGNENFNFDITDYVNRLITGEEKNFGLGLCFTPMLETVKKGQIQYVGFFTHNTNTFFHPYLETVYDEQINDCRNDFKLGRLNRLYLYCEDENSYFNLDEMPQCHIDGLDKVLEVQQQSKGVYYVEFSIKNSDVEPNTILYDKWSNLVLNGEKMDDEEFEFVVLEGDKKFNSRKTVTDHVPFIQGICDGERLNNGERRIVELTMRKKYTTNEYDVVDNSSYRIYVKESNKEIDVITWHPIDRMPLVNQFVIDTNDLIPNHYFIDIKIGNKTYKEIGDFQIVSNITNRGI